MEPVDRIEELIAPALAAMGYGVVRVGLSGGRRPTLQVMIERLDRGPLSVDDCAEASQVVSALLDVEDPIAGSYVLEVSSPGIDRPLIKPADFARFAGFEARVETAEPIDGRRRFRGRILGCAEGRVRIGLDHEVVELPLDLISAAKLVLTDELLSATREGSV